MRMRVECPCGKSGGVPDCLVGQTIVCRNCGAKLVVGKAAQPVRNAVMRAAPKARDDAYAEPLPMPEDDADALPMPEDDVEPMPMPEEELEPVASDGPVPEAVSRAYPRPIRRQVAEAPRETSNPRFYISAGKIVFLAIAATVAISGIMFVMGPLRVWHQWDDIGGAAEDQVKDVISFGLQAHLSETGEYDPDDPHGTPLVDGGVQFFRPLWCMKMPDKVRFMGKSNQGDFQGFYNPGNGEIDVEVAYGGATVAGMVDIIRSTSSFHMTGREVGGQVSGECNGKKLVIISPPKIPVEDWRTPAKKRGGK